MTDFEKGWLAALDQAYKIAFEMVDEYDPKDPYCLGICDASHGIATRIKELKKWELSRVQEVSNTTTQN